MRENHPADLVRGDFLFRHNIQKNVPAACFSAASVIFRERLHLYRKTGEVMRLDKYLKVSRLIKRRTIANEACDAGRVTVNDKVVKASYEVKVGDVIAIHFGEKEVKAEVTAIMDTTKKENAAEMYRLL